MKKINIIISALVLALLLSSCGGSKAASTASENQAAYPKGAPSVDYQEGYGGAAPAEAPMPQPDSSNALGDSKGKASDQFSEESSNYNVVSQRKLIMDGNVSLETFNFDNSIVLMDQLIESVGGFAEQRTVRGKSTYSNALRSANYVIRVPAERFESVLNDMGNVGTVLESNSQGTDITDQYTDSETRVKTLKVQEQTLLEILAKATKLEDVITLESRIAEVRYEIEKIENTLKNYDRLIAYSRITIYIQEVDEKTDSRPVPKTLDQRISGSFTQSLEDFRMGVEDFLVWFVGSWITLLFLALAAVILYICIRVRKRRRKLSQKVQMPEVKTDNKE